MVGLENFDTYGISTGKDYLCPQRMFRTYYFFKRDGILYFGFFMGFDTKIGDNSTPSNVHLGAFFLYAFDGMRVVRSYQKQVNFSFVDRIDHIFSAYWQEVSRNTCEKGQETEWLRGSNIDSFVPLRASGKPVDFNLPKEGNSTFEESSHSIFTLSSDWRICKLDLCFK